MNGRSRWGEREKKIREWLSGYLCACGIHWVMCHEGITTDLSKFHPETWAWLSCDCGDNQIELPGRRTVLRGDLTRKSVGRHLKRAMRK